VFVDEALFIALREGGEESFDELKLQGKNNVTT
jgi:hypothetical protein